MFSKFPTMWTKISIFPIALQLSDKQCNYICRIQKLPHRPFNKCSFLLSVLKSATNLTAVSHLFSNTNNMPLTHIPFLVAFLLLLLPPAPKYFPLLCVQLKPEQGRECNYFLHETSTLTGFGIHFLGIDFYCQLVPKIIFSVFLFTWCSFRPLIAQSF